MLYKCVLKQGNCSIQRSKNDFVIVPSGKSVEDKL